MTGARLVGTLTLADGTTFTASWSRRPRFWKSDLMRLTPYGTDYRGARFTLTRGGES